MSLKYSIIVLLSLFRKEKLESLLSIPTVSTELIAVDTNYNRDTKEYLKKYGDNFYHIVYLPSRSKDKKVKFQYASLWNTAFLYAEGDWIVCIKPGVEPTPKFLWYLDLTVTEIESGEQDKNFAIISDKEIQFLNDDESIEYGKLEDGAYVPFDVAVFPRKYLDVVNGYDELYDYTGSEAEDADEDFFCRLGKAGCAVYFDKELSNSYDTYPTFQFVEPLVNVFYFQRHQIMRGKVRAFNDFDYSEDSKKCLAERMMFEIV